MPRHPKFEKFGHRYDRRRNRDYARPAAAVLPSDVYGELVRATLDSIRRERNRRRLEDVLAAYRASEKRT